MTVISSRAGAWASIAVSILVAMGLSMIVRPATAELNRTLGTVWPFSMVHCHARSAPGCDPSESFAARGGRTHLAQR